MCKLFHLRPCWWDWKGHLKFTYPVVPHPNLMDVRPLLTAGNLSVNCRPTGPQQITDSWPTVLSRLKIEWKRSQNFSSWKLSVNISKKSVNRTVQGYLSTWSCLFTASPDCTYQNLVINFVPTNYYYSGHLGYL